MGGRLRIQQSDGLALGFCFRETADPLVRVLGLCLSQEQSLAHWVGKGDPSEEYMVISRRTSSEVEMGEPWRI